MTENPQDPQDPQAGFPDRPEPPKRYFQEPAGFEAGQAPQAVIPGKPSGGLTALAIVTIVFSSLMLLMNCCGVGGIFMVPLMKNMPGMQGQPGLEIYDDAAFMAFAVAGLGVNLAMYAFALAGGIGMLKLRRWGRKVSVGYAIASLVIFVVSNAASILFMQDKAQAAMQGNPLASMFQGPAMRALSIALNFTCLNTLPVFILIVLTRASVRDQFDTAEKMRGGAGIE